MGDMYGESPFSFFGHAWKNQMLRWVLEPGSRLSTKQELDTYLGSNTGQIMCLLSLLVWLLLIGKELVSIESSK